MALEARVYDRLAGKAARPECHRFVSINRLQAILKHVMYNGNTVEPHLALELIERTVRLARADTVAEEEAKKQETALQHQRDADPEKEKEEEKPERPQPQWDGPDVPQNARPWDGPTAPEHLLIGSE